MSTLTQSHADLQSVHELDVFGKRGPTLVRGQGAFIWDDQDRRYIDCIGGQGSLNTGHSHPTIADAIAEQAQKLIGCPGSFYNDIRAQYLYELTQAAPNGLDRAFLCNSGTEAVEAAIKFARITTGRNKIIAAKRAFHGRTYGALSATFNPKYAKGCGSLVPDFHHVAFNKTEPLIEAVDDHTAAVILEVVQGEGGVHIARSEFVQTARQLCDRHGALLIIDEVQTGFARTGQLFACKHFDLLPDILCLAKSIAGGMPMGATLVNQKVQVNIGQHGSTFGGNPLACAAASATLTVIQEEDLATRASQLGAQFSTRLENAQLSIVKEIRQIGLMIGIELTTKVQPILKLLMEKGVLALPAGPKVLRLLPPLVIGEKTWQEATDIIIESLHQNSRENQ